MVFKEFLLSFSNFSIPVTYEKTADVLTTFENSSRSICLQPIMYYGHTHVSVGMLMCTSGYFCG